MSRDPITLLYLADPMCSWCWGFAPVVDALRARYDDRAPLRLIAAGLYPGTRAPMNAGFKATVRTHWKHVHELTGQPFDFEFIDRADFSYDTEPSCRALVVARTLRPGSELDLLERLHAAFYCNARDITRPDILAEVAAEAGLEREAFACHFDSPAAHEAVRDDFDLARELGMRGLPTLLAHLGDEIAVVTEGYRPAADVLARIDALLARAA